MGHEHGVFHLPPGFVFADDPPLSGTIDTPNGAIKWSRSSDGSVAADYGDQRFTATYVESTNGDWTRRAAFMRAGQAYLVLEAAVDHGHGVAHATIEAGQSSLTLAVSAIDPAGQSGTATLSGDIPEANVGWTGPVDLASNPLLGTAIPGLPRNTFDAEFKMAAVFWPLIGAMVQPPAPGGTAIGHASFGGASTGTGGHIIMEDKTVGGVLEHAGAWCAGGAIAGSDRKSVV